MTRMKKLLALLVSAALAVSLLAGCGGSKALSQVIADLLSGQYNNVSVEVDPALTAALKKAAASGDTQDEVLAALLQELNLAGLRLTLRQLQDGHPGDRGVELVFHPGADPDAAARTAVNGWASAFGSLPDDGQYTARVAMIEADGGYYIAVDVEVTRAGTPDKDDPDYTTSTVNGVTTYTVYTAAGLQEWAKAAQANLSTNCTLARNIDLTGQAWTPIGTDQDHSYIGTFDGQGHTISGLNVNSNTAGHVGLFGYIGTDGTVQALTLVSPTVSSGGDAGAVAGVNDGGTIADCHVTGSGTITGFQAGGVVGSNSNGGKVTACSATGKVEGTTAGGSYSYAGGVVGYNASSVTNCSSTAEVKGTTAGGVVGYNVSGGEVTACYATGSVTATGSYSFYAGGVVGYNSSEVTACYSASSVTATGDRAYAGGVAGYNDGTVTDCYWSGSVAGDKGIGGGNQANSGEYSPIGDTPPTNKVSDDTWAAAVNNMNQHITGYTFDGSMTSPTLTKS